MLREIEGAAETEYEDVRWDQRPVAELAQHILDRYHAPLRTEIPRLVGLAELEVELMEHIHLENNILFPRALGDGGGNVQKRRKSDV